MRLVVRDKYLSLLNRAPNKVGAGYRARVPCARCAGCGAPLVLLVELDHHRHSRPPPPPCPPPHVEYNNMRAAERERTRDCAREREREEEGERARSLVARTLARRARSIIVWRTMIVRFGVLLII